MGNIFFMLLSVSENFIKLGNVNIQSFYPQILLSVLSGIFGGILALVGQVYFRKKENVEFVETNKFLLYANLSKMKKEIENTYDRFNKGSIDMVSPINVVDLNFNYIITLCNLKKILKENEIQTVMEYFENIIKFDTIRYSANASLATMNSLAGKPEYIVEYNNAWHMNQFHLGLYKHEIEELYLSKIFREDIDAIIRKLK